MTSSRRRHSHTEHDGDEAWGHVLSDAWRERLKEVDDALTELGDPLRDPLTTVTGAEFIEALWRIPQHKRNRFLADLKVPAARRPSASIEEGVGAAALARMRRWKDDRLNAAVTFVTYDAIRSPIDDLAHAAVNKSNIGALAERCLDDLLATPMPPGLLVAGLVAALRNVAPGAVLAVWLRRQPVPGTENTDGHEAVAELIVSILDALPWALVAPAEDLPDLSGNPVTDDADFRTTVDAARQAYEYATGLAAVVLENLQQLRVPKVTELVESLDEVRRAHETVASAAIDASRAAGLDLSGDDADLPTLIAALTTAAEAVDPVRQAAQRLDAITLNGELGGCKSALVEVCEAAIDGDAVSIEVVFGLVRLADAKMSGASLAELSGLDTRLRPVLPAALQSLPLGIMLGQAQLSASVDAANPGSPVASAATDAVTEDDVVGNLARGEGADGDHGSVERPVVTPKAIEPRPSAADQTEVGESDRAGKAPIEPAVPRSGQRPAQMTIVGSGALLTSTDELAEPHDQVALVTDVVIPDGVRGLVHDALNEFDTGLAHWLALAGEDNPLATTLKIATLTESLRGDSGPVVDAAVTALEALDPSALGRDRLAALAALAAALRTTIVTGSSDAATVLELLSVHVADYSALSEITQAIAVAGQRSALVGGQLRSLRDSGSVAAELLAAQKSAREELSRPRTVLLARATDMARHLFAPHGAIGALLTAAIGDDRRVLEHAQRTLEQLGDPGNLKRLVDELDREMRASGGGSSRPLQGKARQKLNSWITAALDPVREWVRTARLLQRGTGDRHLPGDLVVLKNAAVSAMPDAREELGHLAGESADGRAGSVLIGSALDTVERLLAGLPPAGSSDSDIDEIVGRALLRVPRIALDGRLRPLKPADITIDAVAEALGSDWEKVIAAWADAGDFRTARHAIAVATSDNMALQQRYTSELDARLAAHRADTASRRSDLRQEIGQATWRGQIGDDDQIRLITALEAADPLEREDLNVVDAKLATIAAELPELRAAAGAEIAERLQRLVNEQEVSVDQEGRVKPLIDKGDFASADEILAAVEAGQDLPDPVTLEVLDKFFPAVPDSLSGGLTREVIDAVRAGTDAGGCSFRDLPEETRTANADALDAWREATASKSRGQVSLRALAAPLRLAGIEAQSDLQLPAMIRDVRSNVRRFVDLTGVRVVGNAIVPAFGTLLNGRLRLLLVWGPQTPQSIVNWVAQDKSDAAVLVCLFGTMSADARRKLAVATVDLPGKPVALLDDAALTFLASWPESSITTTMQVLLPFATTNPYVPQAEGNVPTEMFYGRGHELVRITGPTDSLLYGGRQLGKSALLRAAERRHIETGRGIAVYVSTPRPDSIWDALRRALDKQGIRAPGRERREAYTSVTAAVEAWLEENPTQRLLVLIDECDDFFDLDAEVAFKQTTRLRDLRNQTAGRFKPVFAGLHEVARFASLPNQPFAHLGKPLPIGPLAPAEAFRLVTQPLATLGIRFAEDLAAWRVLAYCNNQPILLQLVCQHLVNHVHEKRDEFTLVPYVITDDEFEQVWRSPTLVAEVSGKLKLTLDLDPRYGVVARVLGLAAHEDKTFAMSTVTLRDECGSWWPKGFAAITDDEFRALLIEMVTLGVLAQDGTSWALRSVNVRRMLGSSEDIAAWLLHADRATVPGPHLAGETRQQLAGARVAPLTEVQLADVIGQRNQLRIVLGSRATGADLINDVLEHSRDSLGRFELIQPRGRGTFLDALSAGKRGGKHRVVYSNVTDVSSASVLSEIDEAHHRMPEDGVTRSAVLYLGMEQAEIWLDLLGPGHGQLAADTVVACRRLTLVGLERWSHEQHGQFSDPADRDQLLAITGGWPFLVDSVAAACAAGKGTSEALAVLRDDLEGDLGRDLLDATGLADSPLSASYDSLVALGAELLIEETDSTFEQVLADTGGHPATLSALIAVGAVTRNDDGTFTLEPVLANVWEAHRGR